MALSRSSTSTRARDDTLAWGLLLRTDPGVRAGVRDAQADFDKVGATVLGVSPDSPESHARFRDKYALGFRLLADQDHAMAEAYGAWGEKTNYGKTSMGIIRSAFVIDEDGKIVLAKYNVKPDATAPGALAALASGE